MRASFLAGFPEIEFLDKVRLFRGVPPLFESNAKGSPIVEGARVWSDLQSHTDRRKMVIEVELPTHHERFDVAANPGFRGIT